MSGADGNLQGYNLYVYCFNNPLMYTDSSGNRPEWVEDVANWFKENIGFGIVQAETYPDMSFKTFFGGINKIGITQSVNVDFGNRTAEMYYHGYVRTIPLAATAIITYYTKGAVAPMIQGVM